MHLTDMLVATSEPVTDRFPIYRSITRRLLISRCPTTEQGGRPIRPALPSSLDGHGQEHSAHLPVQVDGVVP